MFSGIYSKISKYIDLLAVFICGLAIFLYAPSNVTLLLVLAQCLTLVIINKNYYFPFLNGKKGIVGTSLAPVKVARSYLLSLEEQINGFYEVLVLTRGDRREREEEIISQLKHLSETVTKETEDSVPMFLTQAERCTKLTNATKEVGGKITEMGTHMDDLKTSTQTMRVEANHLSTTNSEISQSVRNSLDMVDEASQTVSQTDSSISVLEEATAQIGDVVDLIAKITKDTRLLALNATIEAQRAGEAGQGFAIVASEVKQLAEETDNATQKISSLIHQTKEAVSEVVKSVDLSQEVFDKLQAASNTTMSTIDHHHSKVVEILQAIENGSNCADDVVQIMNDVNTSMIDAFELSDEVAANSVKMTNDVEAMSTNIALAVHAAWKVAQSYPTTRFLYNKDTHAIVGDSRADEQRIECKISDISKGGAGLTSDLWPSSMRVGVKLRLYIPETEEYIETIILDMRENLIGTRFYEEFDVDKIDNIEQYDTISFNSSEGTEQVDVSLFDEDLDAA